MATHSLVVGYCRVSTDGQSLESQQVALKSAGAHRVYSEKISGAKLDRRQLQRALDALGRGDVLIVTRIDRLARSTRDLLNILHRIGEAGASFKSLADDWCNTTTAHGRLLITFLAGIAEFERELIRARTGEGRKRAKANGVRFGRPFCLTLDQRRWALAQLAAGKTQASVARILKCDATTVGRLLKRDQQRELAELMRA